MMLLGSPSHPMQPHIPFTQYLRPHGKTRIEYFETQDEILVQQAYDIINSGFNFECELLASNEVSLTISNGSEDLAIELIQNGPEVPKAVQRLIENFHKTLSRATTTSGNRSTDT